MKDDRLPAKKQYQPAGMKVVFSEKAFLAIIYAIVIGFSYLDSQIRSVPPKAIEQVRSLENK
jgi:hypothetical protein